VATRWVEQIERLLTVDEFLHHLAHLDTIATKVLTALEPELALLNGAAAAGAASTLSDLRQYGDHPENAVQPGAQIWREYSGSKQSSARLRNLDHIHARL
jgi:hypothetical protein